MSCSIKEPSERCDNVADDDRVVFTVTLTLEECKAEGDIIVSVGVGGHRDVVAVYITPQCTCECESLENIVSLVSFASNSNVTFTGAQLGRVQLAWRSHLRHVPLWRSLSRPKVRM